MITQRELDIAQIEAKLRAEELYNEWHSDFLANRGKRGTDGSGQGNVGAESGEAPATEDYAEATGEI